MYRNKFLEHEAKELKQITAEVMNTIVVKTTKKCGNQEKEWTKNNGGERRSLNNSRLESHILLHTSKSYYFY